MIQRIQTVYLAVAALLLGAAPFAGAIDTQPASALSWFVPGVGLTVALAFVAAIVSIFLFSNRRRQRLVVILSQFFVVLAVGIGFAARKTAGAAGVDSIGLTSEGWAVLAFPAVAYVLLWLARRAIDKDTELVRSMDRIR